MRATDELSVKNISTVAALAESEARLRRSQELGRVHPYEWDLATNVILARPGLGQLFGLAANEPLTYEALVARIHPDDCVRVRAAHQSAIKNAGPYEQEYRVLLPEGRVRWILARGEVVRDQNSQPTSLAGVTLDITRRKEAEIALAEREAELAASERRFRALADAMPQIVWSTQPDGYHDYYNRRWYEFTGVPEGSTDGEEWNGMFHPDDRERAWAVWRHSLETGEPYEIDYRLRHQSGEYRWVLGRALPVRNEQGAIERWFGTCTDIQDLKRTEQALAESEEFTRRLLASSDDCIKVLDLDANLRFMSEGGHRVMEVDDFCKIEGCHWPDFWTGPTAAEAYAAVEAAKAGGTGRFEGFCPTVAGTPKWWDVAVTAIQGRYSKPERLLSISRDITERKRAEQQLAETAERYRLAARATNDAIWDWDLATDHIQWNEAVQTLFGYMPEEVGLAGRWWKAHIHPDDRERVVSGIHAVIDGPDERWSDEYRFRRADGSYASILDRGYVLRNEAGQAVRMIGAMLDISQRKKAEEALAAERARLKAIFETVPVGILIAEAPLGRIVDGNPQLERILRHPVLPSPDMDSYREWMAFHPDGQRVQGREYPLARAIAAGETSPGEEYLYERGDGSKAWIRISGAPIRNRAGQITGGVVAVVDIDCEKRREADLHEREALLSSIVQSEGVFTSVTELLDDDLLVIMANERTAEFFRRTPQEMKGATLSSLGLPPEEAQRWVAFARECHAKGHATTLEYPFQAGDRSLYCFGTFTPLPKELSERPRLSSVSLDITERKRLEESQALVSRELHHRVKNSLATVQAVVSSTARHAQTIAEFRESVMERIASLAKTHTLLINNEWGGASLRDILLSELEPYDDKMNHRVRLTGPDLHLPSEVALAFGMAVHELTTNAAKYGAFSLPSGCVHVTWTVEAVDQGQRLALEWKESDGPLVNAPERQGFGSVLLQRALGRQLGGEVETIYAAEGLKVRITAFLPRHIRH